MNLKGSQLRGGANSGTQNYTAEHKVLLHNFERLSGNIMWSKRNIILNFVEKMALS